MGCWTPRCFPHPQLDGFDSSEGCEIQHRYEKAPFFLPKLVGYSTFTSEPKVHLKQMKSLLWLGLNVEDISVTSAVSLIVFLI